MSGNDFIYVEHSNLSGAFCDALITKFDCSEAPKAGETGQGVDSAKKDSLDLVISQDPRWKSEVNELSHSLLAGLLSYFRRYPFLLVGATSLATKDPQSGMQRELNHEDIRQLSDADLSNCIRRLYRLGDINLQKYQKGVGGYHHWHSEFYPHPNDPQCDTLHRVLLWMYYLNDVEEGGETAFYFQNTEIKPKQGTLVIAPAGFTHTHKGQVPISNDKYILTSWLLFRRSEQLYA